MTFGGQELKSYLNKNEADFVKFRKSQGLKSNYSQYANREILPIQSPKHENTKQNYKKKYTRYFDKAIAPPNDYPPIAAPSSPPTKKLRLEKDEAENTKSISAKIQKDSLPKKDVKNQGNIKTDKHPSTIKRGYQDIIVKPYKDAAFTQAKPNIITIVVFSNT